MEGNTALRESRPYNQSPSIDSSIDLKDFMATSRSDPPIAPTAIATGHNYGGVTAGQI